MKNNTSKFSNIDYDDEIPNEQDFNEEIEINNKLHSSDCQESILTKDKGHIKIEDRASFIDEIKIAFNTVRMNKMLINSAIDETEQHSGKNITHNPFLFVVKKCTDQNDESSGERTRRKFHKKLRKNNKCRKLKSKESIRSKSIVPIHSKSKVPVRIRNESSTSTYFCSTLRVPENYFDSFYQTKTNFEKSHQFEVNKVDCRVSNDDEFIARNITVKDLLPCIVN